MRIGFDAYFAFHFKTGVAHYGRNLINSIARYYPETELLLFTDKKTGLYDPSFPNVRIITTGDDSSYHNWLQCPRLTTSIHAQRPDIFHGLDHGLPALHNTRKIVTMHDLFFESHPFMYPSQAVAYYRHAAQQACSSADVIISISECTRQELVARYQADPRKIRVCYQSCNPLFFESVSREKKDQLRQDFDLPQLFWLYVGSVTERKNLLNICKALHLNREISSIPLVVIGEGDEYLQQVRDYIHQNNLADRVRFLSYTKAARSSLSFQQARDIPAFYQMAKALLYPSFLEGFGIPLIEAFASGLPVITSRTTSMPETGGDAALYIDPSDPADIAVALLRLEKEEDLCHVMIKKGTERVQQFTAEKTAAPVMEVYRQLI